MQIHDTGRCMKQLYAYLNADAMNATQGLVNFSHVQQLCESDIVSYRDFTYPAKMQSPAYVFKWLYQLETVHKRFLFKDDAFSQDELKLQMEEKFQATQVRLGSSIQGTELIRRVLSESRKIVKSILGQYDLERHVELCAFGTEAAVGVKARESYMDTRLDRPLSGSVGHIHWFITNVLKGDPILQKALRSFRNTRGDIFDPNSSKYERCDVLRLTGVPKSFKALRGIMPNTELGCFYSSGLGELIVERLADHGLDIRTRAEMHARWVRTFSVNRTHVTADLSAASDSFTAPLINALVPRDWYRALKLGRIKHVDCGGRICYMNTFMTMGIGFTFPLQTLLFYAILKSIAKLCGARGIVSTFGDDLIYPRYMHRYATYVLGRLGFVLNVDKTFSVSYFRESCGSDFYHGVDVRPFQPEGVASQLNGRAYASFLYKLVNGLRLRWTDHEIPLSLDFLLSELKKTKLPIYQVPSSFPDHSGWQVDKFHSNEWFSPVGFDFKTYSHTFKYLKESSPDRVVLNQYPYYWNWLARSIFRRDPSIYSKVVPPLKWVLKKKKSPGGQIVKKLVPHTAVKRSSKLTSHKTHTSMWGPFR